MSFIVQSSAMTGFIPAAYTPLIPVHEPYTADPDVIEWRSTADGMVVQEIFRSKNGNSIGIRYKAWINVSRPDATARHRWWPFRPKSVFETADAAAAEMLAVTDAQVHGLVLGRWVRTRHA